MARTATVSEAPLFSTMNVTPFIDVMLVLLIMMILTLPPQNHKVAIDLPQGPALPERREAAVHVLAIQPSGALLWDGHDLAVGDLRRTLVDMQADASAVLHVRTDGEARYERFDEVLATVKRAGVTRLAFVGNEGFRNAID